MGGVGFWELSLLFVVGLLVLGPERLPGVARTVGGYVRKMRQTWTAIQTEINQELALDEAKQARDKALKEAAIRRAEASHSETATDKNNPL